jgi:hypothetical protein
MTPSISRQRSRWLTPAAWFVAVAGAAFQPGLCHAGPDPLDPKAEVPAQRYESSLAGYRRSGEAKPIGWREANDTVNRIGGWRAYAREAQQPDPAAGTKPAPVAVEAPAPQPAPTPKSSGQSGHKHH